MFMLALMLAYSAFFFEFADWLSLGFRVESVSRIPYISQVNKIKISFSFGLNFAWCNFRVMALVLFMFSTMLYLFALSVIMRSRMSKLPFFTMLCPPVTLCRLCWLKSELKLVMD